MGAGTFPGHDGIAVTKSTDVKVYNNIIFNNEKSGLYTREAPGYEGFNNILFQNDLTQIHIDKGDEGTLGFNRIIRTREQGPPFRRQNKNYPEIEAYHEEFPDNDVGTKAVDLPNGEKPLDYAKKLLARVGVHTRLLDEK